MAEPNYSDVMHFLGNYYACGELGVVFEEKGFPNWLVKVINQDAEDDENLVNMYQSQFFETVWEEQKFRGLPKLKYFWEGECENVVKNHLTHTILKSKSQAEVNILGLSEGDLMSIWIMERLDKIGTDHSKPLSKRLYKGKVLTTIPHKLYMCFPYSWIIILMMVH